MTDLIGGITPREYLHGIVIGNIVPNQTELLAVLKWADEQIRRTPTNESPAPQAEFQPTRVSEDKYLGGRTDDELAAHFATMYHGWERGLNITQERCGNGDTAFTETPMTEMELAARYVAAEIGLNIYEIANKAAFAPIIAYSQIQARLGPVFEGLKAAASPAPQADSLVARIDALLDLDASGSLVPHGIGGLARELLLECRERLSCG